MTVQQTNDLSIGSDKGGIAKLGGMAPLGRRAILERFTFALPLLTVLVFAIQYAIAEYFNVDPLTNPKVINAMVGAFAVNVIAALTYREFRRVPGTRRFAFILPSYIAPVLVLFAVLLGFRLGYTNYLLAAGIGTGVAFMYAISAVQRPTSGRQIYLVPGKRTRSLASELYALNTQMLHSPEELIMCGDGAVVVDLRQDLSSDWERGLAHAVISGVPVYNVKQVQESLTGRVKIESLSENSFGALIPSLSYLLLKRAIDLVLSFIGLVVLAIPMLLIALGIKLSSQGPALYRHRRIGYRGHEFETLKFRTMAVRDCDDDDLESQKTQANDTRITPFGNFLRKTRLDELPQLINVLRGEMSLIGPRPEALALSRWYDEHLDFYEYRHIVRPGITGWAQVNQGHVTELDDVYVKLQYDFYYIKNVSAWLDLLIALRTIGVMVSFRGAR